MHYVRKAGVVCIFAIAEITRSKTIQTSL